MAIDKEVRKKNIQEWLTAFPQLSEFSTNKLLKIVGPLLVGVEIIQINTEEYRPHFVIYPLWKLDVKSCLEFPIIL